MKPLALLSDYWRAIMAAAAGSPSAIPAAVASVLRARLRNRIGPRYHSLYDLARTPQDAWNEFVIDVPLKEVQRAINAGRVRELVIDKVAFTQRCHALGLPAIPILATMDRMNADDPLNSSSLDAWLQLAETFPDRVFIKRIDGSHGRDAFVARRVAAGRWAYSGTEGTTAELHAHCQQTLRQGRGWLVQAAVRPHAALHEICAPHVLCTVRAITCLWAGAPEVLYGVLRLPTGENRTDNFGHGASGNIVAPIDLDTGVLGTARGSRSRRWPSLVDVHVHPDTGGTIPGFRMPFWEKTRHLLYEAQRSFPEMATAGWDIAIAEEGPMIVEANTAYDVDLLQVALRRGLRSELLERRLAPLAAAANRAQHQRA